MYHPYYRGKQFELLSIRENADLLQAAGFVPIVEPVKKSFRGLRNAITEVNDAGGEIVVVINPSVGDLAGDPESVLAFLRDESFIASPVVPGIIVTPGTTLDDILYLVSRIEDVSSLAVVHAGFTDGKALGSVIGELGAKIKHIFPDHASGLLYRRHFRNRGDDESIVVIDGHHRRNNADYKSLTTEWFADVHLTYEEMGFNGFGDYLIVGDYYSSGGGPAWAVAIHICYIDPEDEDQLHVAHFVSDSNDSQVDPAGKFMEALAKLIAEVDLPTSKIYETKAIAEFRDLHSRAHYPGLGYVKKLSMGHHVETYAKYFYPG